MAGNNMDFNDACSHLCHCDVSLMKVPVLHWHDTGGNKAAIDNEECIGVNQEDLVPTAAHSYWPVRLSIIVIRGVTPDVYFIFPIIVIDH